MSLVLTDTEIATLNAELEPKLAWAKTRSIEAEQLALDCTRLLSCTEDRLSDIKSKGFFKRCWNTWTGKTAEQDRANTGDLIQMQKKSLQFIKLLQEQNLMLAHSMITIKNNLVTLAIKETETRHLLLDLAGRTLERFEALENRVGQLEVSTNLQGWLVTIKEREYEEKFPTPYFRTLKIVNDFYRYKNDDWNFQDFLFMKKALRDVGLNPKESITMNTFIDCVVDEAKEQGFAVYERLILEHTPKDVKQFSHDAIENISSLVFTTMLGIHTQYVDKAETIEAIREELSISREEALKRILRRIIKNMNVDLDVSLTLSDIAVEILASLRLSCLVLGQDSKNIENTAISDMATAEINIEQEKHTVAKYIDVAKLDSPKWIIEDLPNEIGEIKSIIQTKNGFILFTNDKKLFLTTDFQSYQDILEKNDRLDIDSNFFDIKQYNGKYVSSKVSDSCYSDKFVFSDKISDDGIFWKKIAFPENKKSNIFFSNNTWYAITQRDGIYESKDLKNWNHIFKFEEISKEVDSVYFINDIWVLQCYYRVDRPEFFCSKDCLDWADSFASYSYFDSWMYSRWTRSELIFLSGQYIFYFPHGTVLYYSKNGIAWIGKKVKTKDLPYDVNVYPEYTLCTGYIRENDKVFSMSNNGIDWMQYNLPYDEKHRKVIVYDNKCIAFFPSQHKIATWNLSYPHAH